METLRKNHVKGDEEARERHLKGSSPLRNLDPMLEDGLLRVEGRLRAATMDYEAKHPLILPGTNRIARLIIEEVCISEWDIKTGSTCWPFYENVSGWSGATLPFEEF